MAFQTGVTSSIDNLMDALRTFAQAQGWTQDFHTSEASPAVGKLGLSKNGQFVNFAWSANYSGGSLAHGHNLSNDNSGEAGLSTGDDGCFPTNIDTFPQNVDQLRHTNEFNGPHVAYWFFENDSAPHYIHVVVEVDTGRFRHFGFGELEKVGDWTGGQYCYGHFWNQSTTNIDNPASATAHRMGLEAKDAFTADNSASVRVQGMPEQAPADRWMICRYHNGGYPDGTDLAGNNRGLGFGGWRGGINAEMSSIPFSPLNAFKPLLPVSVFWFNSLVAPDRVIFLGNQPDVRMVNMQNIDPGEILTIAGEQWYVFPWVRKQFLKNNTEESWNGGVAYRREDA